MRDPDLDEQAILQESRTQERTGLSPAERRVEALVGGLAAAAIGLLWVLTGGSGEWIHPAAGLVMAGMIVCRFVRFDVGGGFTVPMQVAYVPLLFVVPPAAGPVVVLVVMMAGRAADVVRREISASRLVLEFGNTWFSIGPAIVLAIAGGPDAIREHWTLALVLLAAQFGGDFLLSSLREVLLRKTSLREQLRDAAWIYGVDAALTPAPLVLALQVGSPEAIMLMMPIIVLLGSFARERRKRLDGLFEMNNAYHGTAMLLGDVVEADDTYTGEHCRDVVELAMATGRHLGLSTSALRNLEFAALLHDVGKVAIPKSIVNKPGKLDPHEWEIMKTHTTEGQRMLEQIGGFMQDVGRLVRSHHERWDGGGYPDGLAGEDIPIESRIVTVCDSYNAMTTDRPYRSAMPRADAVAELQRHSGSQFDSRVAQAVIDVTADLSESVERQHPPLELVA